MTEKHFGYLSRFSFGISWLLFLGAAVDYLILPTQRIKELLGAASSRYFGLSLFVLLFAGAFFAIFGSIFSAAAKTQANPSVRSVPPHQVPQALFVLQLGLALVIVVRVLLGMTGPLDIDENCHATNFARGHVAVYLNPFRTQPEKNDLSNHIVAHATSMLSMKVFGLNKLAFRLPSVLFALATLVVFLLFSRAFLSPWVGAIVLGHLAMNDLLIWYLHSQRGYVSMIFFSLCLLYYLMTVSRHPEKSQPIWLFVVLLVLNSLTNTFGALFSLLAVGAFAVWTHLARNGLSSAQLRLYAKLIVAFLLTTPFVFIVILCNAIFLSRLGDLYQGGLPENLFGNLNRTFGFSLLWFGKLLLLWSAAYWIIRFIRRQNLPLDFLMIFNLLVLGFFGVILSLVEVRVFHSRYVVAFVIPLIAWAGQLAVSLTDKLLRVVMTAALALILMGGAAQGGPAVHQYLSASFQDFDRFVTEIRKQTSPVNHNCYRFSGKEDLSIFASDFYFRDASRTTCDRTFHAQIITEDPFSDIIPTPDLADYSEKLRVNRMVLWERLPSGHTGLP